MSRIIFFVLILFSLMPSRVEAEGVYVDVYGDMLLSGNSNVSTVDYTVQPTPASMSGKVSLGHSYGLGIRAGGWFNQYSQLGYAFDFSYVQIRSKQNRNILDVDGYIPSFMLMFRPLSENTDFFLQPYLGAGIAIPFFWITDLDISPGTTGVASNTFDIARPSFDARAGVCLSLENDMELFMEYRYFESSIKNEQGSILCQNCPPTRITNASLNTHHVLAGIRF